MMLVEGTCFATFQETDGLIEVLQGCHGAAVGLLWSSVAALCQSATVMAVKTWIDVNHVSAPSGQKMTTRNQVA